MASGALASTAVGTDFRAKLIFNERRWIPGSSGVRIFIGLTKMLD